MMDRHTKGWMFWVLWLAGIYNLGIGVVNILFPDLYFEWAGMETPLYPELWQTIGMIIGVYGIGYIIAAYNPYRHWPIVLVGLLGKLFGPAGFAKALLDDRFTIKAAGIILTNDLIWWIPFIIILYKSWKYHSTSVST